MSYLVYSALPVQLRKMASLANIAALRLKYKERKELFLEENIPVKEPITIFRDWMEVALKTEEILEPNAACLATINRSFKSILLKNI